MADLPEDLPELMSPLNVSRRLGVDVKNLEYAARKGLITVHFTRGGHARFDLDECRAVLGMPKRDAALSRERKTRMQLARRQAYQALARRHPREYTELLAAAMEFDALTSVVMEKPCPCGGTITRRTEFSRWAKRCDECDPEGAKERARRRQRYERDQAEARRARRR